MESLLRGIGDPLSAAIKASRCERVEAPGADFAGDRREGSPQPVFEVEGEAFADCDGLVCPEDGNDHRHHEQSRDTRHEELDESEAL